MRTTFYTAAAYGTLLADAYLALASIATRMMRPEYQRYLPPFGGGASEGSRILVLLVATWTAVLALGCLRTGRAEAKDSHASGVLWFVLVLVLIWLVILLPPAMGALWNLFVRGL